MKDSLHRGARRAEAAARPGGHARVLRSAGLGIAVSSSALDVADEVWRAAGFFDAGVFGVNADAWRAFFARGGRYVLVTSESWSPLDAQLAADALQGPAANSGFELDLLNRAAQVGPDEAARGRAIFAWGIRFGKISVHIATLPQGHGIYHEKFAVFLREQRCVTGHLGSNNETIAALRANYELCHLLTAPQFQDAALMDDLRTQFSALVKDETVGLRVRPLILALRERLLRPRDAANGAHHSRTPRGSANIMVRMPPETIQKPPDLDLREHQIAAVESWFRLRGRGVFALATGTGKTIAALETLRQLRARCEGPLVAVIVVPYIALASQWESVAHLWGLDPVMALGSSSTWIPSLDAALSASNTGRRLLLSIITTNATFGGAAFQLRLTRLSSRTILIADEVHNLGSSLLSKRLPSRVALRLGLSATPERWHDEDGNRALRDYFGEVAASMSIADALRAEPPLLCEYDYFPVLVALTDEEASEYTKLTVEIARLAANSKADQPSDALLLKLFRRARLVGSAQNKLPALIDRVRPHARASHAIVYCGDGSLDLEAFRQRGDAPPTPAGGSAEVRQCDAVAASLSNELGMTVATYTYRTDTERRKQVLRQFRDGEIQVLVAIRCLDEGVDIPSVRRAFILASSTNPRQFIQRRGRVLRRADDKSRAEIYDFLVDYPTTDAHMDADDQRRYARGLVEGELRRVLHFIETCRNPQRARAMLLPAIERHGLSHLI